MGKRRQARTKLAAPVKIWAEDRGGNLTPLPACTLDASTSGIRIHASGLQPGQIVVVSYGTRRGRFRVVWAGDPQSDRPDQAGLENIDGRLLFKEEVLDNSNHEDDYHFRINVARAFATGR